MTKTTKILGGTLLVALMSLGLTTKVETKAKKLEARDVLTADMNKAVSGKAVRRANDVEAANKVSKVKAQVSEDLDGFRHIRFVAGIDSLDYVDAKFDIVAKDGDTVVKTFADMAVTTAYTHIEAAGEVLAAVDVFGADYNYLVAFTINNVPEAAWGYTFEASASIKTAEAVDFITSEVAEKVITDLVNKDEVVGVTLDLTSSIIEKYNYEAIRNSEELYEGTTSGKLLIGDVSSDKRVYSGIGAPLGKQIDIKGATISFFVKLDSNVYKNRISVAFINEQTNQLEIYFKEGSGNGYTVEPLENNWYRVEIDVDKAWSVASYMSEEILLVTANQDTTAAVRLIIADLKLALPAGSFEEVKPDVPVFTAHDYSDDLTTNSTNSYGCVVNNDSEVSVDGEKSMKITLTDDSRKATGRTLVEPSMELVGYKVSFYVKLAEGIVYNNRITVQFRNASKQTIELKINLGSSSLPNGVTASLYGDGWYYVTIDCDVIGIADLSTVSMIGFIIVNLDIENPQIAYCWIDQLNIVKK